MTLADDPRVRRLLELARDEDLETGDVTAALLDDAERIAAFRLVARQPGVFAGQAVGPAILHLYDRGINLSWLEAGRDGGPILGPGAGVARIEGPLGPILAAERVFLNFLQRLCGIATLTRRFVDAARGTAARIFDTRKTVPGWRVLDKYAVRCGGGYNHRMGLHDGILIKDNHLRPADRARTAGAVFAMLNRTDQGAGRPELVAVEAQNLADVEPLLGIVGVNVLLLDNFAVPDLRRAVECRDALGLAGRVALEASGGVTLNNVREVAETGVDRISVGAITHSAPALDLALDRL
jgi:nicotinate-nucleotide pyrophosphorylase (carboxylating)